MNDEYDEWAKAQKVEFELDCDLRDVEPNITDYITWLVAFMPAKFLSYVVRREAERTAMRERHSWFEDVE